VLTTVLKRPHWTLPRAAWISSTATRTVPQRFIWMSSSIPSWLHSRVYYLSNPSNSFYSIGQSGLERTNSPTFLTLFNNTKSLALFSYCKLRTFFTVVNVTTVVKQLIRPWVQFLHNYGLKCHKRMACVPWLPDLIFYETKSSNASFTSTSEFWNSAILERS
jgi:hypothetical protein